MVKNTLLSVFFTIRYDSEAEIQLDSFFERLSISSKLDHYELLKAVESDELPTLFGPSSQTAMVWSNKVLYIAGQLFEHVLQTEQSQCTAHSYQNKTKLHQKLYTSDGHRIHSLNNKDLVNKNKITVFKTLAAVCINSTLDKCG